MLGVTLFGIFLTPVFYRLLRSSTAKQREHAAELRREIDAAAHPFHAGIDDAVPPKTGGAQ
jgi:multidrug efflux pump